MFECPTCGGIFERSCQYSGTRRHVKKCKTATSAQRKAFKTTGHWPRKGSKLASDRVQVPV